MKISEIISDNCDLLAEDEQMTREELKEHCKKQVEMCEMWAIAKGEKPHGRIYEEHKLILELLEQEPTTGHWILKRTFPTKLYDECLNEYKCSECYREIRCTESQLVNYPYCHCGAKMSEIPTGSESEAKE